ncbi:MAG: PilN domain-containing protein [Deltaproteobacteria bacterium]|nr:PilN domain-containing protein [Deltaproteobacteria bacterium]
MIRINLLPVRQVRKVRVGQRQLLLLAGLVVVEIIALFVLYTVEADTVSKRKAKLAELQDDIQRLKTETSDYDLLIAKQKRLLNQKKVINSLTSERGGPLWVMRELSALLSRTGRPTFDAQSYQELVRRNPSAGINLRWDPRRLWIETLNERGHNVTITGKAKDYDDVAELLKRLTLSRYFQQVELRRNDQVKDSTLGLKVVRFSLTCQVKYRLNAEG